MVPIILWDDRTDGLSATRDLAVAYASKARTCRGVC
jgi:hypothetical protein